MKKLAFLTAAAVMTSLVAGPALAKDVMQHNDKQTVKPQKIHKQARAQMQRIDRRADRSYDNGFNRGYDRGIQQGENFDRNLNRASSTTYYYGNNYDNGFWPAAAAANVVTDTVLAADAIATAPFRDTYAYDNSYDYPAAPVYRTSAWDNGWDNGGWNNNWSNNWARRQSVQEGGFICTPGSYYTNSYGYSQLCQ